jgi:DNA-binding beta-propeller fold protein YncE
MHIFGEGVDGPADAGTLTIRDENVGDRPGFGSDAEPEGAPRSSRRIHGIGKIRRKPDRTHARRLRGRLGAGAAVVAVFLVFVAAFNLAQPPSFSTSPRVHDRPAKIHEPLSASVVRTVDTSRWFHPSPDPSGIAYRPASDVIFVADSEVDETSLFEGSNVWMTDPRLHPMGSWSTIAFSSEPSDIALAHRTLLVMDDETHDVNFVRKGRDLVWGTPDDIVSSVSTIGYGVEDPEGIAFGRGHLFIADGDGRVFEIEPNANRFVGGGDVVRVLDVSRFGLTDPEGVAYDGQNQLVYVIDRQGLLLRIYPNWTKVETIDTVEIPWVSPSGITVAPASDDPSEMHLYVAARGTDNDVDPAENDGRIFELALAG